MYLDSLQELFPSESMRKLLSTVILLMSISGGCYSTSLNINNAFYKADVSTGCKVYYHYHNSKMTTLTCPLGQVFDQVSCKCQEIKAVQCIPGVKNPQSCIHSILKEVPLIKNQMSILDREHQDQVNKMIQYYFQHLHSKYNRQYSYTDELDASFSTKPETLVEDTSSVILFKTSRVKRVPDNNKHEVSKEIFQYRLTNRLILPLILEIMQDSETVAYIRNVLLSARAAYSSIYNKIFRQSDQRLEDVSRIVPEEDTEIAKNAFFADCKNTSTKIMDKHLFLILRRLTSNIPLSIEMIQRLNFVSVSLIEELRGHFIRFVVKYGDVIRKSKNKDIDEFMLETIKRDFHPIENIAMEIFSKYLSKSPSSFIKVIFNELIYRLVLGERPLYPLSKDANERISIAISYFDSYFDLKQRKED